MAPTLGGGGGRVTTAAICQGARSAWHAVSSLLEYARSQAGSDTIGRSEESFLEQAAALSASLEGHLTPRESAFATATEYTPEMVGQTIAAVSADAISLTDEALALTIATVLDRLYWPTFTRDWLSERGTSFELKEGDLYPINEMRLMGDVGHSARPHRLHLPPGELAHVRRLTRSDVKVQVIGEYAPILDRLASSPPLEIAALLPNESLTELRLPPNQMGPANPQAQRLLIDRLLRDACREGVDVVVLPELSVDQETVEWLSEKWATATDLPILFAGSAHLVDDGQLVNRASVLLPGVGTAWHHDKFTVFEGRNGIREPVNPAEPCITLGCGNLVRVATLVCKDALSADHAGLVADLGAHLLAVPAMSASVGEFSTAANLLIARSQGAMLVANNPRLWQGTPVAHALLGQPVPQTENRCRERLSEAAPDQGIARLGTGWR